MREDAVRIEEERLQTVETIQDYNALHERHRIFPAVFEDRQHERVLDLAAGVGCSATRIKDGYPAEVVCNDISPKALTILDQLGLSTVSFNIDDEKPFPFPDGDFDAVVALATIEHIINIDHLMQETRRILVDGGHLYISAPNYAGLYYLLPFVWSGRTFHNPLVDPERYEFYAHVRYFTYRSLVDYVSAFGFVHEATYLGVPSESSAYKSLYSRSKPKALAYRWGLSTVYHLLSPRWAAEPVLCFRKEDRLTGSNGAEPKARKIVL